MINGCMQIYSSVRINSNFTLIEVNNIYLCWLAYFFNDENNLAPVGHGAYPSLAHNLDGLMCGCATICYEPFGMVNA